MPDTEKAGSKETIKQTEAYETETELPEKEKQKYRDEGAAKIKSFVFMADEGGISPYMTITGLLKKREGILDSLKRISLIRLACI